MIEEFLHKVAACWKGLEKPERRGLRRLICFILAVLAVAAVAFALEAAPRLTMLVIFGTIVAIFLVFLFEVWDTLRERFTSFVTNWGDDPETEGLRRTTWFFAIVIIAGLTAAVLYRTCCEDCDSPRNATAPEATAVITNSITPATNVTATSNIVSLSVTNATALTNAVDVARTNTIGTNVTARHSHGGIEGAEAKRSMRVQHTVTIFLWSFACLACGTFAGFLFGIPKVFQSNGRRRETKEGDAKTPAMVEEEEYRQQVNTNLTEISDWITKIIVGLGLINLKVIPGKIMVAAEILARGLQGCGQPGVHVAFAVAVILFFSTIGFLFGYLMTRLFLAAAFSRADVGTLTREKTASNAAIIGSLQDRVSMLQKTFREESSPAGKTSPAQSTQEEKTADVATVADPLSAARARLSELADEYNRFKSPDLSERVRVRNRLAEEMAILLNRFRQLRDFAVSEILSKGENGYLAGLAAAINAEPDEKDVELLLQAAPQARYRHSRFKVATAIGRLFVAQFANSSHIPRVLPILKNYRYDADDTLRQRIRDVISLITQTTGQSLSLGPE